ncbi:ATP-binding protein, partial [Aeromonas simiae]|uniref:ATP-dependent nuclease n=1 Tax=Aeromonas simiae TaxID=218936 RepID=UPI00266BC160
LTEWANPADFYLIAAGVNIDKETYFTSTLDKKIRNSLRPKSVSGSDLNDLKNEIYKLYEFIYLPVDVSSKQILDIQSDALQGLMDKNLTNEIENLLNQPRERFGSIVSEINEKLDLFLTEINKKLFDDDYTFATPTIGKKTIHASDITDAIIKGYFEIRTLQKEKKSISNLSSGEQRRALIDVASVFVKETLERRKKLILCIDEPEASLSVTSCYEQFKKIFDISLANQVQMIISTHWYGVLMSSEKASLHHLSNDGNKIELKSFNLHSVHEERRSFPASVEMKSFLDLVSSMLMIMKNSGGKWIVCEGSDDKNYLEKLISPRHSDVNILPLGGVANVVKLFDYFKIAASDKIERAALKGKILFIIDSDRVRLDIDSSIHKDVCDKISIRRFQMCEDGPKLIEPKNSGLYTETELEDCLNAADFYSAAESVITDEYNSFSKNFRKNTTATFAEINNGLKFIIPKGNKGYNDMDTIRSILSNHKVKYDISVNYKQTAPLPWVDEINSYFD